MSEEVTRQQRATSFGSVAAQYERFRLGYPEQVADLVLDYARGPVLRALDVGAGTGKATRVFAERGVDVLAIDPDPAMLAELSRQLPATPKRTTTFEDLPIGDPYDLVFSAAALHWTDPNGRWERIAAHLRPGGVVAAFGGGMALADPALEQMVDEVRDYRYGTAPGDRPEQDRTPDDAPMPWPGWQLLQAPQFTDVREYTIARLVQRTRAEVLGWLATISAFLILPAGQLRDVLARIGAGLPDVVQVRDDITIHLARRT